MTTRIVATRKLVSSIKRGSLTNVTVLTEVVGVTAAGLEAA
jgi:hypothetical protein